MRTSHFDGNRFFYPGDGARPGLKEVLKWKLGGTAAKWPAHVERPGTLPNTGAVNVLWIGQSTLLIQGGGKTWLTDPVFSDRVGPVPGVGPKRVTPPALALERLPKVDAVLLSHDHYDHCDLPSIRRLPRMPFYTPLNYRSLLPEPERVQELDWWQSADGVTLVPSRHWSRRSLRGTNLRLWGGFVWEVAGRTLYFAGDTGFDAALFREIRDRCGAPDLAFLPIGAYAPRWFMQASHMNPEEAVQAHQIVGAKQSLAIHWGTLQLTDEPYDEPVARLEAAKAAAGVPPEAFIARTSLALP